MSISYDDFTNAFLSKILEYNFLSLDLEEATSIVDGYMITAISQFKKNCLYDLTTTRDDEHRTFDVDISAEDKDEIVDIIACGMVVQWIKPYVNQQELLQNVLSTRDFDTYSPAELLLRVGNAYKSAQKEFVQAIREYSYNHGDLTSYHI